MILWVPWQHVLANDKSSLLSLSLSYCAISAVIPVFSLGE